MPAIVITARLERVSLMPDCMEVPLVYLNSWHIGMPMISRTLHNGPDPGN